MQARTSNPDVVLEMSEELDDITTRHVPSPGADDAAAAERVPGNVPCPYCARAIAVADFSARSARPQLLSAACGCGRIVTMATTTLRRRTTL